MANDNSENLIKRTCRELGITQRELCDLIGYGEDAVSKAATSGEMSRQMRRAIELLLELYNAKAQIKAIEAVKNALKTLLQS